MTLGVLEVEEDSRKRRIFTFYARGRLLYSTQLRETREVAPDQLACCRRL